MMLFHWLIICLLVSLFVGCSSKSTMYKVEMWSGGKVVRTWTTTHTPASSVGAAGYYHFQDSESGQWYYLYGNWTATKVE